jgi:hypothetical protein
VNFVNIFCDRNLYPKKYDKYAAHFVHGGGCRKGRVFSIVITQCNATSNDWVVQVKCVNWLHFCKFEVNKEIMEIICWIARAFLMLKSRRNLRAFVSPQMRH